MEMVIGVVGEKRMFPKSRLYILPLAKCKAIGWGLENPHPIGGSPTAFAKVNFGLEAGVFALEIKSTHEFMRVLSS